MFAMLREAGLFLVYMGVESGVEAGFGVLKKEMTIAQNVAAVETLKELGIAYRYGFKLFDPASDYQRLLTQVMRPWVHGEGLSHQLDHALDELDTICRLVPGVRRRRLPRRPAGVNSREERAAVRPRRAVLARIRNRRPLAVRRRWRTRAYCESVGARLVERRNRFGRSARNCCTHPQRTFGGIGSNADPMPAASSA
jgi:hypothetical protein